MMRRFIFLVVMLALAVPASAQVEEGVTGVRIKDLGRIGGARDNLLVGYGLVTGLAGTGDSARSAATVQSITNLLTRFGVNVPRDQVRSRNVAAVMVAGTLPPFAQPGDRLDVNVTSVGDARSLVGGILLLTHLTGPDGQIYMLAQGPISVGGFSYDMHGNMVQKNHPTSGIIPGGAVVERVVAARMLDEAGQFDYVLHGPDFTTAGRVAEAVNRNLGGGIAHAVDAARVRVRVPPEQRSDLVAFMRAMENLSVTPDRRATVVINERTGTVVAGGDVRLAQVSVTHGDLRVAITTEYLVSQPFFIGRPRDDVRTAVVPRSTVEVEEDEPINVALPHGSTVGDLVLALNRVRATSRDVITILQAIKQAGGLHAELIVQ